MMVTLGNFFFHYRNSLAPVLYILLFIPFREISDSYYLITITGMVIALAGQAVRMGTIGLVYIVRGGSKGRIFAQSLVTEGVFSHARNPMYVGNVLIMAGLFIMANSFAAYVVIPLVLFFYQAIVLAEENFLRSRFGKEYDAYAQEVGRWIPNMQGIGTTFKSLTFNWRRVILKEFNTAFIVFLGILIIIMKNVHAADCALFSRLIPYALACFIVLLASYLLILYLKKSKKLRA